MKNGRLPRKEKATARTDAGIVARTGDLFDAEPVPLGIWPSAAALEGRFLGRLLLGATMTAGDWLKCAHSMRLAAEVEELRGAGWLVQSKLEEVRTRDRGRPARIARYWLDERQRKAAAETERGRHFLAAVDVAEGRRAAR